MAPKVPIASHIFARNVAVSRSKVSGLLSLPQSSERKNPVKTVPNKITANSMLSLILSEGSMTQLESILVRELRDPKQQIWLVGERAGQFGGEASGGREEGEIPRM